MRITPSVPHERPRLPAVLPRYGHNAPSAASPPPRLSETLSGQHSGPDGPVWRAQDWRQGGLDMRIAYQKLAPILPGRTPDTETDH